MSHGGAREGAGRKPKFKGLKGEPLPTKRKWIPEILNDNDIQKATTTKLEKLKDGNVIVEWNTKDRTTLFPKEAPKEDSSD